MRVIKLDPGNVQALFSYAYQRGNEAAALEMLQMALQLSPRDPMISLTLARIHRDGGHSDREWNSLVHALTVDAYFLPALLAKAEFYERHGRPNAAAEVFRDVLQVAPPPSEWPPALQRRLEHACNVDRDIEELVAFLNCRVRAERATVSATLQERWDEAVSIMAGETCPYHSACNAGGPGLRGLCGARDPSPDPGIELTL